MSSERNVHQIQNKTSASLTKTVTGARKLRVLDICHLLGFESHIYTQNALRHPLNIKMFIFLHVQSGNFISYRILYTDITRGARIKYQHF